jgi:hypothetical protein
MTWKTFNPKSQDVTLLAAAARTSSGTSVVSSTFEEYTEALFLLNVTAAATEVDDTLDVYLQKTADNGTTWDDFVHFTQVLGNGGAKKFIAEWTSKATPESEMHAAQDGTMAVGVAQGPLGKKIRVKWVIVDPGGGAASFTFTVTGIFKR